MNVKVLEITLHQQPMGLLFQYGALCRFVPNPGLAQLPASGVGIGGDVDGAAAAPVLSLSMLAATPEAQSALWLDIKNPLFNATGHRLPAYFQNLLPEGVLRTHIATLRGCAEDDHFELLAACGGDLPGAVGARPIEVARSTLQRLVTQDHDALEMSVVAYPLTQGISVSGVQPKMALLQHGGRYTAPRRLAGNPKNAGHAGHAHGADDAQDTQAAVRIIAKLPVVGRPGMPLLEKISLDMARAAGVDVCDAQLAPLAAIDAEHRYALPDEEHFLAVRRFDRDGPNRIHFEDFAQILATDPQYKYRGSYLDMARAMLPFASLGEAAVLELLRRITVNDLLGNPDAHLKNFGVIYPNGTTPRLAPAYDIVAYAALYGVDGHALPLVAPPEAGRKQPRAGAVTASAPATAPLTTRLTPWLTPSRLRSFCVQAGIAEPRARRAIAETVAAAATHWPALLANSGLPNVWQSRLQERLAQHPLLTTARRRPGKPLQSRA